MQTTDSYNKRRFENNRPERLDSRPPQRDFKKPGPVSQFSPLLDKSAIARMENLQKAILDPVFAASLLDVSPVRIEHLLCGREIITPEVAHFIEEGLKLPPSSLDHGNVTIISKDPVETSVDVKTAAPLLVESNESTVTPRLLEPVAIPAITMPSIPAPQDLSSIRMANLRLITDAARGVKAGFCQTMGKTSALFTKIWSKSIVFNRALASEFERAAALPDLWFDTPQNSIEAIKIEWFLLLLERKEQIARGEKYIAPSSVRLAKSERAEYTPVFQGPTGATTSPLLTGLIGASTIKCGPIVSALQLFIAQKIEAGTLSDFDALRILNLLVPQVETENPLSKVG